MTQQNNRAQPTTRQSRTRATATVNAAENPENPFDLEEGQQATFDAAPETEETQAEEAGLAVPAPSLPSTRYVALDMDNPGFFADIISENLGDEGLSYADLERMKMPSGKSRAWIAETSEGQLNLTEIKGVIIHHQKTRAYWEKSIEESSGNMPPDCSSEDGRTGVTTMDTLGGDCASCPMNQFGTARNRRGKACTEKQMIYVLQENRILPMIVQAPPTSLKSVRDYMLALVDDPDPKSFWMVETEFSLATVNADPFPYPQLKLRKTKALDAGTVERLVLLRKSLLPALQRFTSENYQKLVIEDDFEDELEDNLENGAEDRDLAKVMEEEQVAR